MPFEHTTYQRGSSPTASLVLTTTLAYTMPPSVLPPAETSSHNPLKPHVASPDPPADRRFFPDGLRTSGQHPVLEDKVFPYDAFPKTITGPTVWMREDYQNRPDRWTHPFSPEEIEELSVAADSFITRELPLTGMTTVGA